MDNRRDFLKKAAALAGSAGLVNMLPPSVQKALAIEPAAGSTWRDAEHVVFLMQENRSFDHCFGTLQGVRGFNDPRAITLPDKNKVWLQTNEKGETFAPFRLNIKDTKATWMNSLPHAWDNQVDARNTGRYDKWLDVKKADKPYENIPMTMGYYTREDIPFYYALADAFTVCDQHFCSSLTGTTPNRLFFWSGAIREDAKSRARVRNAEADYEKPVAWKSYPERLEEAGIDWKIYQNEISVGSCLEAEAERWLGNFGDNAIEYFTQYHVKLSKSYLKYLQTAEQKMLPELERKKNLLAKAEGKQKKILESDIKWDEYLLETVRKDKVIYTQEKYDRLSAFEKSIHDKAFTTNVHDPYYHELEPIHGAHSNTAKKLEVPKGDVLHQFRQDVQNGRLPAVSWLVAPEYFCDHPSAPWYGAWYISEVMDILTQNPEVWKKTIFILTYDENDGCFDHVPPFVPPHTGDKKTGLATNGIDTEDEFVTMDQDQQGLKKKDWDKARAGATGLGFRVPMVIASPWSRGGWVCSEVFDHTSCLQFLEKFISAKFNKEVVETNISTWRRAVCGNLTSAFHAGDKDVQNMLPFPQKDTFIESIYQAQFKNVPDNYKQLTAQEISVINTNAYSSPYMPQQEKGVKKSCALPYELYVDGQLGSDEDSFIINFKAGNILFGKEAAGAAFHVYAPGNFLNERTNIFEPLQTWAYTAAAGKHLKDTWPLAHFENGIYHLCVYGPNGFYRAFKGSKKDPQLHVQCMAEFSKKNAAKLTGNVALTLHTFSKTDCVVQVTDNAYKAPRQVHTLKPGRQTIIIIPLEKSFGWYDFTVTAEDNPLFSKQFAGRIETGEHGFTDPLMGQVV